MIRWFLHSLTRHWDLLWQMVLTDLRGRYVGSSLGLFWTVIHPLVMILIFTIVFSRIMGARLPGMTDTYAYGIYLCSALLPWIAFQEVVNRATTIFPDNANLVRKVAFPKAILYGFVTLSSAINVTLALGVFVLVILLSGHTFNATFLLWFPSVALQLTFGLGLGILTSVLHVFVRDTAQLMTVFFQIWFWITPIVYVETILPSWLQRLLPLNPLYLFCASHRDVVLHGQAPAFGRTLFLIALTVMTLAAGIAAYRRFRSDILDEL